MALDSSGALLEGIRISTGNNPFTFPPRTIITDRLALDSIPGPAEYALIAASTDPAQKTADIADTTLRFRWVKNESTVLRFTYDFFSGRWAPLPGAPPDELGPLANDLRIVAPVPDETVLDAPFAVYIGHPVRLLTFTVVFVGTAGDFSVPSTIPDGTVEMSKEDGQLNFAQGDVDAYGGVDVLAQRQGFFDRQLVTGSIGELPLSSALDYFLFMNPRPASGQSPRIRIGHKALLTPVQVPDEGSLGTPVAGTVHWSLDTGRVRFAPADVDASPGVGVYYDGLTMGELGLTRTVGGPISSSWPSSPFGIPGAVGVTDPLRFAVFAELPGTTRRYFRVTVKDTPSIFISRPPRPGNVYLDDTTGAVYFSSIDAIIFSGWTVSYVDTVVEVEDGVSVQFYRSGVNESGVPEVPDFHIVYSVDEQVIVDGIYPSPFVMLPTVPIDDDDLEFKISRGPSSSGTFTGVLVNGIDPAASGFGYLLNLDTHQLSFSNRKSTTKTIRFQTPSIKLDDAAISELGFEVERDGIPIVPGVDFDFDPGTGLMEFLESVGENAAGNLSGLSGDAVDADPSFFSRTTPQVPAGDAPVGDTSLFVNGEPVFSAGDAGKFLFVPAGDNVGIRTITAFVSGTTVRVYPPFFADGATVAEMKETAEVVADRFWTKFLPPYKKFSLARADSPDGPFTEIPNTEFNVFKYVGQVNLSAPTRPEEALQITYVALESDDDGATYAPVNKVERALFKIRQETATFVGGTTGPVPPTDKKFGAIRKVGTSTFTFNPDGRTVNTARPIAVYVNGMLLQPEDFTFDAPGTIKTADKVGPDQIVVLDYWVEDSPGGNTSFNLLSDSVDLDTAEVVAGEQEASYNGDQTGTLAAGSALFVDETEVVIVQSSSYDPFRDVTGVRFESVPTVSSDGADILVTASIIGSMRVTETAFVDVFTQGTRSLFISGDQTANYVRGTVVTVDGDPYSVQGSRYDEAASRTSVDLAGPAKRNYAMPSVTRTKRPVLFPGGTFQTARPANIDHPFTLVRMGNQREVLESGVDFFLAEGGSITLVTELSFGDELVVTYVARDYQRRFTTFEMNYAYAIAPGPTNGIVGQRLLATYNLYAPDTFFYRTETIDSFIPEVVDLLRASASSGSSGPNTGNVSSQSNEDFGSPSLYFEEQHQGNLDVTIARLLKFYNDLVNVYEDLLSDMDGRIVGGNQGRFRFDGNFDNPIRDSFDDITNDIDDVTKIYDKLELTGFFSFNLVPVYGTMAVPNAISRIFPTLVTRSAAFTNLTAPLHFGSIIGSLDQTNIRSLSSLISTKSNSFFDEVDPTGLSFTIPVNGDAENKIPPFAAGQDVEVYSLDGILDVSGKVVSADDDEPATVVIDTPATVLEGSLLRNVDDGANPENSFYTVQRDLIVDFDNGQVTNFSFPSPGLGDIQNPVKGEEIVDGVIKFENLSASPKLIPALYGSELNDDERPAAPRLRRTSEAALLDRELSALLVLGFSSVSADKVTVTSSTISVIAGQEVTYINGPNAGLPRIVLTVISPSSFTVTSAFLVADPGGSDFEVTSEPYNVGEVLTDLVSVISTSVAGPPANPASRFGPVDSEIRSVESAIACWGDTIASGTGTTTPLVLTDAGANFTLDGAGAQSLLFVPSGANRGLYKIDSVTATTVLVDVTDPYVAFPSSTSTPYTVISPENFLSTDQFDFVTKFYRDTLAFLANTEAFGAAITTAGKVARRSAVLARRIALAEFVTQLEGVLLDGKLYETRYLWIDQRTNRRDGLKTRKTQAEEQRAEDEVKLVADQQKLLIATSL